MLGNIAMYFANRAAGGAVGSITRYASWGAVAAVFVLSALIFGVMSLYMAIEPRFGPVNAALLIALGSLIVGLGCLAIPFTIDMMEKREAERRAAETGQLASTLEAAKVETAAAVDYFGPLQVLASAFLIGMRTGAQVRVRRSPSR
jgi:hypothetical protein